MKALERLELFFMYLKELVLLIFLHQQYIMSYWFLFLASQF